MESFVEFVTDKRIIECLCRKRASEAGKRHDAHHRHALSSDKKIPVVSHIVYSLTPPRRQWIHLGEKGRLTAALGGRWKFLRKVTPLFLWESDPRFLSKVTPAA